MNRFLALTGVVAVKLFLTIAFTLASSAATALASTTLAQVLADAMTPRRVVLLGEVHDNGALHALRLAALRLRVEAGAKPAIAFEQFDRERQADIDRARRERPRDADYLIEQAGDAKTWRWEFYRPLVQLALDNDLPIVAANLSRTDAMKVARDGWSVVLDASAQERLGVDRTPVEFRQEHQQEIKRGHCDLLPAEALPAMARAQIARDLAMAQAITPYLSRGVVLLAGNGHVRRDIGVPFWLAPEARLDVLSVGLLEVEASGQPPTDNGHYDLLIVRERAERPDPCEELRKRFAPKTSR